MVTSERLKELWANPEYSKHMSDVHKGKTTSDLQKKTASELWKKNNPMFNKDTARRISMAGVMARQKKAAEKPPKIRVTNIRIRKFITCKKCLKEFSYLFSSKERLFCSNSCAVSFRRAGTPTGIIPKSAFKKNMIPWNYIDGHTKLECPARYGDDWENIRYLVYKRDNFSCQNCGLSKQLLHIHHIIPFVRTQNNSLDNLICLCPKCHRKEDGRLMKEFKKLQGDSFAR